MRIIKSLAYGLASLPGAPQLLQRAFTRNGAAILMYHGVTRRPLRVMDWVFLEAPRFRAQMLYLTTHCRIIPLREMPAAIEMGKRSPLVALTFDDGFQNNYTVAYPILHDLGLPATIFLTTGLIDSEDTLWYCRLNKALAGTTLMRLEWEGESYDLSTLRARAAAHSLLQSRLKRYSHRELLRTTTRLVAALGDRPGEPIAPDSEYRMLRRSEIREMADTGLIEFGAHSCSHATLSGLSQSERRREILDSITAVERLTESPCSLFAYPYGDYGPSDVATLRQTGIAVAVTTVPGPNDSSVSALEMRRYGIGADTPLSQFKLTTHHVLWGLRNSYADFGHGRA